jgi:hypothetical protein
MPLNPAPRPLVATVLHDGVVHEHRSHLRGRTVVLPNGYTLTAGPAGARSTIYKFRGWTGAAIFADRYTSSAHPLGSDYDMALVLSHLLGRVRRDEPLDLRQTLFAVRASDIAELRHLTRLVLRRRASFPTGDPRDRGVLELQRLERAQRESEP